LKSINSYQQNAFTEETMIRPNALSVRSFTQELIYSVLVALKLEITNTIVNVYGLLIGRDSYTVILI
jgi:hypothetical protein